MARTGYRGIFYVVIVRDGQKLSQQQKMGFRKVIVCLLLFGVAVLLVQMLALSSLSETLARLPWETEEEGRKTTKEEVRI